MSYVVDSEIKKKKTGCFTYVLGAIVILFLCGIVQSIFKPSTVTTTQTDTMPTRTPMPSLAIVATVATSVPVESVLATATSTATVATLGEIWSKFKSDISSAQATSKASRPTDTPGPTDTPAPTPTPTLSVKQMQDEAETVTFKELARNTEKYVGKLLKYEGQVVQVVEDSGNYQMRVNVTKSDSNNWTDTVFLICEKCPTRPLDQDIVSFVGNVEGRLTYQSILGGEITLPKLTARVFDVVTK